MDTADAFDKGWHHGHRCGYMDAVSEIWEFMKDIPNGYRVAVDLADFLRARRDQVLSHADEIIPDDEDRRLGRDPVFQLLRDKGVGYGN